MLQLNNIDLEDDEKDVLASLQRQVDAEPTFISKTDKANALWKTKGGVSNIPSFEKIRTTLEQMCVGKKLCNYCECNEASDIEHIEPKSFFPEKSFVWNNYLLACKTCNTGYKLDKCFVLDSSGDLYETTRGNAPLFPDIAMINPRIENPIDFIWLSLSDFKFNLQDDLDLTRENKANKTIEILALNERSTLIHERKSAAAEYYNILERLKRILKASSIEEIKDSLNPHEHILTSDDEKLPIQDLKNNLKSSVEKSIKRHRHPSVWYAIKTIESKVTPKWQSIFNAIPEALHW